MSYSARACMQVIRVSYVGDVDVIRLLYDDSRSLTRWTDGWTDE